MTTLMADFIPEKAGPFFFCSRTVKRIAENKEEKPGFPE
jgi:hypothetical protein